MPDPRRRTDINVSSDDIQSAPTIDQTVIDQINETVGDSFEYIKAGIKGPIGNVIWVSPTGDDSTGEGSLEKPLRSIEFAIERCADDNNDFIILQPGKFEADDQEGTLLNVNGLSVIGSGWNTILSNKNASAEHVLKITGSNVTVCNLQINEMRTTVESINLAGPGCRIRGVLLDGTMKTGIMTGAISPNSVIEGCVFKENTEYGIRECYSHHIIRHNQFFKVGGSAICLWCPGDGWYNIVYENQVHGGRVTDIGIECNLSQNNIIANNYVGGCAQWMVDRAAGVGSTNVWIGNRVGSLIGDGHALEEDLQAIYSDLGAKESVVEFWSDVMPEIVISATPSDIDFPDVTVPENRLPAGAEVTAVTAMLRWRKQSDSSGAVNAIKGSGKCIRVKKAAGAWGADDVAAITLPDNTLSTGADAVENGCTVDGNTDIGQMVNEETTYNFRAEQTSRGDALVVDGDSLILYDVQVCLKVAWR